MVECPHDQPSWQTMRFRILPLYLVISCSGSMGKESLESVMQGIESLKETILQDPMASETLWMSVIVAGSDAWQIDPLVPIDRFNIPFLFQEGAGDLILGAAFKLVNSSINRELVPKSIGCSGDFCPLIFVLVDHAPTDDWVDAATSLLNRTSPRIGSWLTMLTGTKARREDYHYVPGMNLIELGNLQHDQLKAFFRWIDQ